MDVASMVLGIVSLVFSFFCGCISIITAPIGLVLGIVDLVQKKEREDAPKGMSIAGITMCSISLAILIGFFALFGATEFRSDFMNNVIDKIDNSYDYNF